MQALHRAAIAAALAAWAFSGAQALAATSPPPDLAAAQTLGVATQSFLANDKAAVQAAQAKLKADMAAGNSAAIAADKAALAAALHTLKADRAAVSGQMAAAEHAAGLTHRDLHASAEGLEHGKAKGEAKREMGAMHLASAGGQDHGGGGGEHGDHGNHGGRGK